MKGLKSGSVSADDVARAKAQYKAHVMNSLDTESGLILDMVEQATLGGSIVDTNTIASTIDSLTASDISAVRPR